MKKSVLFIIVFQLANFCCFSQLYIEPVVGYGLDIKNGNHNFKQFNTAIQFSWQTDSKHEFLLKLEKGWGISAAYSDSSFTLNPSLPVYSKANKTMRPGSWSFATGSRLKLTGKNSQDVLSAVIFLGLSYQKISVSYQYNKGNYIILNPDRTQERFGPFASGGFEYMHLLPQGRLFVQAIVATAPAGRKIKYPSSFGFLAPLSFNAGYSIPLSKRDHDK